MAIDIGSTNNGVYQWLFQRKTNFLIVVYGLVMASHFLSDAATDYSMGNVQIFPESKRAVQYSANVIEHGKDTGVCESHKQVCVHFRRAPNQPFGFVKPNGPLDSFG